MAAKKKPAPKRGASRYQAPPRKPVPGWVWLTCGLLIGAFLIERFFSIPGIGREIIMAVDRSDFPVIKAITVYVAFATMAFNLLADLMYRLVDPRVQLK